MSLPNLSLTTAALTITSLASAVLSGFPLVSLLTDVFFSKHARDYLGRWWASAIGVAFLFLGTSCLVVGAGARGGSGGWLSGIDEDALRSLATTLLIVIGVFEALCL